MGYQETWIVPKTSKDFDKLLDAYHRCAKSGYYSDVINNAAEPLSVILLKKQIGAFPAGTACLWAVGDRNRHNADGIFNGKLPNNVRFKIVPVESVIKPGCHQIQGVSFAHGTLSENEYMRRIDVALINSIDDLREKQHTKAASKKKKRQER